MCHHQLQPAFAVYLSMILDDEPLHRRRPSTRRYSSATRFGDRVGKRSERFRSGFYRFSIASTALPHSFSPAENPSRPEPLSHIRPISGSGRGVIAFDGGQPVYNKRVGPIVPSHLIFSSGFKSSKNEPTPFPPCERPGRHKRGRECPLASPETLPGRHPASSNLLCVLSRRREATVWGTRRCPGQTDTRAQSTSFIPTSSGGESPLQYSGPALFSCFWVPVRGHAD
jgi:hypothetical protein